MSLSSSAMRRARNELTLTSPLSQDSSKPHVLLIHPNSATIPLMWKALSQQISTYSFGYIRDADAAVRGGLSLSSDPDGPKIIFWKAGASSDEITTSFERYEGEHRLSVPSFVDSRVSSPFLFLQRSRRALPFRSLSLLADLLRFLPYLIFSPYLRRSP